MRDSQEADEADLTGAQHELVEEFAETYGLADHLDVFHRVAQLLQHIADNENPEPDLTAGEAQALGRETSHPWHQPRLLYFTILVCSLGAIEQGWAQTGINGANLFLGQALGIDSGSAHDSFILGLINCGIYLAQGLFGAWLAEPVNSRLGRRGAILLASSLALLGNIGSALSPSWQILLLCRLILGTGLGLNSSTVNVYAAESAPAYIRGGLGVSWQMFTAAGICLGFLANVALYSAPSDLIWRLQLAVPLAPLIPLLLLIYSCPESAAWFTKRSKYGLAFASLSRLRNTELQAACEVYSAYLSNRILNKELDTEQPSAFTALASLITVPRNRHALYASYTVMLSQQICGINIIAFYSSTIFSSSGFSTQAALWASVIFGLLNFLFAIPAIWLMDALGRRSIMLWTLPPMALTMFFASLSLSLPEGTARFVLLAGLVYLFCMLYSPGVGPVPCAYSAEVFPLSVRELGMSAAISTASLWATVLSLTFPALLEGLGEQGSFGLYAGLNVVAWLLCWMFVRETKGVSLDHGMDEVFLPDQTTYMRQQLAAFWQGRGRT
ncbi:hypothetical protein BAUCODRAFT_34827 [Baudoinia panamericana UAMH 10762]|uniref:Major facilitator superfamily (MFS) profile domain-containing protein n=1 Tax=Baudoinia panamericana (strain UAMH 10762) TaxID=717646 RepID=M2MWZ3_BAUPA|nr:uncharacterized protein BAUCODRAFT_34827 [Baudoinia panamericana UAMH 10762]EMC96058.1 hypothetical protein BAUCODRAFT_34827 [Baudoinia panamericana UAMH 10762]